MRFLIIIAIGCLGGCVSKTPISDCAGFRELAPSPAALAASIKVDRPFAERVIGNDDNGHQLGCW